MNIYNDASILLGEDHLTNGRRLDANANSLTCDNDVFRRAVDISDSMVFQINGEGCLTYINPRGELLLEIPSDQAMNARWLSFVHENDKGRVEQRFITFLDSLKDNDSLEFRYVGINGLTTPVVQQFGKIHDVNGVLTGVVGIARNIAEQQNLKEQLYQSQKVETIGMLTGGVAHDFNNMLTAILGYTELMIEDKDKTDPDYRALTYIQMSTERAAGLVKQLLLFSRRSSADFKPVDIVAVIRETLQMLQRTLPKTIRIIAVQPENSTRVIGDAGRIQQAIMNLCLNARDAMPHGGELRIEVLALNGDIIQELGFEATAKDYALIRIKDTGYGMPPHVAERIWDPFFTTKPAGQGTGLGLSVVKNIIKEHQGHIQVDSVMGCGTVFNLYLPIASSAEIATSEDMLEPAGGEETILIVDDEPVLLDLLYEILNAKGYHVLTAASGDEALDYMMAVGDRIHLLISDNMMPGMTGAELTEAVHDMKPDAKILVCSGYNETSSLGVNTTTGFIQKPYQRRELLRRVRDMLDLPVADPEDGE